MTRRSSFLVAAAATAVVLLALGVTAQPSSERVAPSGSNVPTVQATEGGMNLGIGTIQYDNDTPFNRNGTDGGTVGNRFTPGPGTHSIASVGFALAGNYLASVVMSVWDVNPGSAQVAARQLVTGIPQSPASTLRFTASLTAPVVGHTGSFVAGIRNTDYDPCAGNTGLGTTCDGVALTQGASPAPPNPSNAARIPFTSPAFVPTVTQVASTGSDIQGVNAIFRATGDNLPVELMKFNVD